MDGDGRPARPERERTDESLRTEREKTDRALAEQRADVEEDADALVETARERADNTLAAARSRADSGRYEASSAARDLLSDERAREDEALEAERDAADARLEQEREELTRALATLLPLEREKTDLHLQTERVRSDDALARRDDFLGMVSHDLRNLLSGIVVNAALLSEGASESEEGQRTLAATARIQRYAARMNRLIADLVDVVSIEAGQLAVLPTVSDATSLLAEAVAAFAQSAAEKGIALECQATEDPLPAALDRERMLQVLANLIANALKFTPRGGRIVVRGERAGDELRLSVSDTGSGIPGGMLEKVFERFWQADADRRGLGLGLYISRCIVEAHQGRIWAESDPGAGSTFRLAIPQRPG